MLSNARKVGAPCRTRTCDLLVRSRKVKPSPCGATYRNPLQSRCKVPGENWLLGPAFAGRAGRRCYGGPRTSPDCLKLSVSMKLAPRAGLEPATLRLTAGCSAIELPRNIGSICASAIEPRTLSAGLETRGRTPPSLCYGGQALDSRPSSGARATLRLAALAQGAASSGARGALQSPITNSQCNSQ